MLDSSSRWHTFDQMSASGSDRSWTVAPTLFWFAICLGIGILAVDGDLVVFDWKSDVAPSGRNRVAYREQLGQYLHVLGAQRGAIVYMTSGRIDWITAAG